MKVFSLKKFIEDCQKLGIDYEHSLFDRNHVGWAIECQGKEVKNLENGAGLIGSYSIDEAWTIEV